MSPHRCYTTTQLLEVLQMSRSTFFMLKKQHRLPFLEELRPRVGRRARFRAELVDRYLSNQFNRQRSV